MRTQFCLLLLSSAMSAIVCGCSPGAKAEDPLNYFLLEVQRPGAREPAADSITLMVQPFPASPGIDQRELVFRRGMSRYEKNYYDRFVADVGSQVAEQTRRWLAQSGCLGQVLPPGSSVDATHLLEGNIAKLYSDFREKANAQTVMEIEFFLVDVRTRKAVVVFHETYDATAEIPEAKAESIIAAHNQCLAGILQKLEIDLRGVDFAAAQASP
ncbi:MAG: membrane integrity-associated transporter subunit PqiC [Phycisphaerales bacterium]|nr:MAG: membrane integrity-associated transporter subunit PqiC [Phycisphaerales bacterium]